MLATGYTMLEGPCVKGPYSKYWCQQRRLVLLFPEKPIIAIKFDKLLLYCHSSTYPITYPQARILKKAQKRIGQVIPFKYMAKRLSLSVAELFDHFMVLRILLQKVADIDVFVLKLTEPAGFIYDPSAHNISNQLAREGKIHSKYKMLLPSDKRGASKYNRKKAKEKRLEHMQQRTRILALEREIPRLKP